MSQAVRRNVVTSQITRVDGSGSRSRRDRLAGEEPMEIRLSGPSQPARSVAVTMRTPGNDFELAVGFLFTEGIVGVGDVERVSYCEDLDEDQAFNIITVRAKRAIELEGARNFFLSSSCGICGKGSIDEVRTRCSIDISEGPRVPSEVVATLTERLRSRQKVFAETGGLHAAGLFDASGDVRWVREDVGRHNAVDKLVGKAVLDGEVPLREQILVVSGRASFEIVQKAAVAGIPIVCAVSAPSSLAVSAAESFGMTLVGFARDDAFNVYSGEQRIELQ